MSIREDKSSTFLYKATDTLESIIPGFIDTHTHAPQYQFTGTATDKPLIGADGWIESPSNPV